MFPDNRSRPDSLKKSPPSQLQRLSESIIERYAWQKILPQNKLFLIQMYTFLINSSSETKQKRQYSDPSNLDPFSGENHET